MVYTVGPARTYKAKLEVWGNLSKVGRTENYKGGCAFQTIEAAQRFIQEKMPQEPSKYAVFGLEANWETDTEPSEDDWWNYLLVNRPIFLLQEDHK